MAQPLRRRASAWTACLLVLAAGIVARPTPASGQAGPAAEPLSRAEIARFLREARIVGGQPIGRGVTRPYRLTLTDGKVTHDAAFNSVDQRRDRIRFDNAQTELNFVDSYHYNIAALGLAELVGLDHMMPVVVERRWLGKRGSLSWWISAKLDEGERLKQGIEPPDPAAWNRQMHAMRVFAALVYDSDRNTGNVLITDDWKLWMIDFTRAFRTWDTLRHQGDLQRCERSVLQKLREITEDVVKVKTKPHLSEWEIRALLARRDKLVAHFDELIAKLGEEKVLY